MPSGIFSSAAETTMVVHKDELLQTTIGNYTVDKILGRGSMGIVYLGTHKITGRKSAIKTMLLSDEFAASEIMGARTRFISEAETARLLNHPYIVTIYTAGEEDDLAFIAMELLNGQDLTRYTNPDNLLPLSNILSIIEKCAIALDYAHSCEVVHRDIKPANIMFDWQTGKIKVTDFGVARIADSSKTRAGIVLGTPSYMSPEQLTGKKIDGRTDIFSLGIMMFQLLTGSLPFKARSIPDLTQKICCQPHPVASKMRQGVHRSVDAVIDKALRKDISERYQTAGDMAKQVRTCREFMKINARDRS